MLPKLKIQGEGVNPITLNYVNQEIRRIIAFNTSDFGNDDDLITIFHDRDIFINNFRKIASTQVGRVLLCRVLIEIRRKIANFSNIGCLGNDIIDLPVIMEDRNNRRSLVINWSDRFSFSPTDSIININDVSYNLTTIGKKHSNYTSIVHYTASTDMNIFHEMIHWYHSLRHPNRLDREVNSIDCGLLADELWKFPISWHYFRDIAGLMTMDEYTRMSISGFYWRNRINQFSCEEFRTIIGSPNIIVDAAIVNGDDLSENLYRACIGVPLKYGHNDSSFLEDNRVIDKVIRINIENVNIYGVNRDDQHCRYLGGNVDFEYEMLQNRKGLGYCKIRSYGI
jgi:hypothetical protein